MLLWGKDSLLNICHKAILKEKVVIHKIAARCSFLVMVVLIGFFVSCESGSQDTFLEGELDGIFSAYSELMDTLDSEGENLEFDDVVITIKGVEYIFNGSLNYDLDGSSVLNVSISTGGEERNIPTSRSVGDITLRIDINKEGEITSFNIDGVDYIEVFIEYVDSETTVVTYYSSGHDSGFVPPPQTKREGENIIIVSNTGNLERSGYTFSGWQDDNEATYSAGYEYTTDEDLDLYAVWTANPTYRITYNGNGNDFGDVPSPQTKSEGESVIIENKPSSMSKIGHSFIGWKTASGTPYAVGSLYSDDANLVLLANWKKDGFSQQDEYPIITGFSVDRNTINTFNEDDFVHFTVQVESPGAKIKSAKVYVKKPTEAPVGSQGYVLASHDKDAPYPTYPDEVDYDGTNTAGTFTLAIPTMSFIYQGTWEVFQIEVVSEEPKVGGTNQRKTIMQYDDIVEEGYNYTIQQTSSDAKNP